jgi:hypothetical protein
VEGVLGREGSSGQESLKVAWDKAETNLTVGNNVNSPIRTSAIGLLQYLQLLYLPSELDIDEQI